MTSISNKPSNLASVAFFAIIIFLPTVCWAKKLEAVSKDAEICRAAIATIMDQKLGDVHFDKEVKQVKYISFAQTPEHSINKFKCSVDDNGRVNWGSEYGAWRDTELDSVVHYEIKDDKLLIKEKYNSGYILKKYYDFNKGALAE